MNDIPTLTDSLPRIDGVQPTPKLYGREIWRALLVGGQWQIVGDVLGSSCVLSMGPYRGRNRDDERMAKDVARALNLHRPLQANLLLMLAAAKHVEVAKVQGLDGRADLAATAQLVRDALAGSL